MLMFIAVNCIEYWVAMSTMWSNNRIEQMKRSSEHYYFLEYEYLSRRLTLLSTQCPAQQIYSPQGFSVSHSCFSSSCSLRCDIWLNECEHLCTSRSIKSALFCTAMWFSIVYMRLINSHNCNRIKSITDCENEFSQDIWLHIFIAILLIRALKSTGIDNITFGHVFGKATHVIGHNNTWLSPKIVLQLVVALHGLSVCSMPSPPFLPLCRRP